MLLQNIIVNYERKKKVFMKHRVHNALFISYSSRLHDQFVP